MVDLSIWDPTKTKFYIEIGLELTQLNINFHVAGNIFIDVDIKELNDVLSRRSLV